MKKGLLFCLTFFTLMLCAQFSWAAVTYTWTGASNSDWATNGNWSNSGGGTHPGAASTDIVIINTTGANQPTIAASSGTISIASITIGKSGSIVPTLTVGTGTTLTLSGGITFVASATATSTATLAGAGTINVGGAITIVANQNGAYTLTLASSVTALNITGNIALTTHVQGGTTFGNPTFSITGGTTTLTGTVTTTEATAGATATVSVASGATLKLANSTAFSGLATNGTNAITLSSGSTINYSGTAQTVYSSLAITGLASGVSYSNLTLSGSGTKTANGTSANNLNISGNFNNATGSLQSIAPTTAFTGAGAQSITLGSGVTFSNITFSGTGIKTVSSGIMNVTGSFTNSLTTNDGTSNYIDFATNSTPLNFTGTTQSIAGGNGTGTDFKNVTLSGTGTKTIASGTIDIISTGTLTLSGSTTVLATGGFLTLKSDLNGSAAVAAITTGSSITGNVNVQRYLTGNAANSRGWRLLSSPVGSGGLTPNLTYVQAMAYCTGTSITGGFDNTVTPANPTFYFYRENMAPNFSGFTTNNFRGVNKINNSPATTFSFDGGDANASLPVGNGFLFFFRGDKATTSNPTTTTTIAKPTTLTAVGTLNQGSITVKPWFTGSTTLSYTALTPVSVQGFNLVGNPYASSIDWDSGNITKTALSTSIWVYNPQLKVYATYVAGSSGIGTNFNGTSGSANIIPSGQGFFVKATSTSAALTFTEASKVSTQVASGNLLLAGTSNPSPVTYLRLVLFKDTLNREDALIFFNPTASPNYSTDEDADYFIGESTVHISTKSADNRNLAVNQMPFPASRLQIALNVNAGRSDTYQLDLSEAKNIPARYKIFLVDTYKKDSVDIKTQPVYTFAVDTANVNTFGSNRFHLAIGQSDSAYRLNDLVAVKSISGVSLIWRTINESTNLNFTIERSNDGGATYSLVGTMGSSGLGTYSLVDKSPHAGVNIYRLIQADIFGGVSYTLVSINYSSGSSTSTSSIKVYPNPATSNVKLAIAEISKAIPDNILPDYTIAISNNTGNIVQSISTVHPENWQTDVTKYAPGMYFVRVINNNTKTVVGNTKFVKL